MKKILFTGITALLLGSCTHPHWTDAGPVITEIRTVPSFNSVSVYGQPDIFLTQDTTYLVKVEGPERRLDHLSTTVTNLRLRIEENQNSFWYAADPKVFIAQQNFDQLYFYGSGDVNGSGIVAMNTEISHQGSGNINLGLTGNSIDIIVNGSGNVDLNGTMNSSYLKIQGSGDIHAYSLINNRADVNINGSGNIYVFVNDTLNVNINGSGNVYYKGYPTVLNVSINGSGDLINAN